MSCSSCPTVPVISRQRALVIIAQVPQKRRDHVLARAMTWLLAPHEDVTVYAGIMGRPYTSEEQKAIALDSGAVAGTLCPFIKGDDGCALIEGGPQYNRADEVGKAPYFWLPTLIATEWAREDFKRLARQGLIADAKIATLSRNERFLYRTPSGIVAG